VERKDCRACGGDTIKVFELGPQHVNAFPEAYENLGPRVPMALMRCHACGLVQLTHTTPREWLYDHYWYRSGVNESMRKALADVVAKATAMVPVGPEDVVVDIGANDGTLLNFYRADEQTPTRVAYEPAPNLAEECEKHCEILIKDFFPSPGYEPDAGFPRVKIITSIAMFYDLEDPGAFVAQIKRILHPEGIWVCQQAYLPLMLDNCAFDNICHEHLTYFGLLPFIQLIAKHGLQVIDVEVNEVNGGSFRTYVTHKDSKVPTDWVATRRVMDLCAREEQRHLRDTNEPYLHFKDEAISVALILQIEASKARQAGQKMDLYGASTKGNSLLQFVGLGPMQIGRAVERSAEKVGRYTVTGIPIVGEETWREDAADLTLMAIWQFKDAVIKRERAYLEAGGTFLVPMPKPHLVWMSQGIAVEREL